MGMRFFYSACDPFCTVLGMRLYSIPAGHRLSPELPREASGMGAVTGGPATGEGEGPRTTAGDQPSRHWHHSAGWLLWCCVEIWYPGYIFMPVRICTNLWRHALVQYSRKHISSLPSSHTYTYTYPLHVPHTPSHPPLSTHHPPIPTHTCPLTVTPCTHTLSTRHHPGHLWRHHPRRGCQLPALLPSLRTPHPLPVHQPEGASHVPGPCALLSNADCL